VVAHRRDAVRARLEHLGVRRRGGREHGQVEARRGGARVRLTERVERLLDTEHRPPQPHVGREDEVPQRLRERPLAVDLHVRRAVGHPGDAREGRVPRALERRPGRAEAVGVPGVPLAAAREPAVELRLDERRHVDPVDEQAAVALREPGGVDLEPPHLDAAHHDVRQVGLDEPCAAQVRAHEPRAAQVSGPGRGLHAASSLGELRSTVDRPHGQGRRR
jgi:hypothetical protein